VVALYLNFSEGIIMSITFTLLFAGQFWVGVFERLEVHQLTVARVVFGSEPSLPEVLDWLKSKYFTEVIFSRATLDELVSQANKSPKRLLRETRRAQSVFGIRSKTLDLMPLELEVNKLERQKLTKLEREAQEERKFELRRLKAKAKHRGH
jgi:Protein of unknown function (DUF2992)